MIFGVGATAALQKVGIPVAAWTAANMAVLSQVNVDGGAQLAAYGVGVTVPFGAGIALFRALLKAREQTERYLGERVRALEEETEELRTTLKDERQERDIERRAWESDRAVLVAQVRVATALGEQTVTAPEEDPAA